MGFVSRTLSIRESAPVKLAVANLMPFEKLPEGSPTIVAPAFSGDGPRSKKQCDRRCLPGHIVSHIFCVFNRFSEKMNVIFILFSV